ncbi:MAG: hypothetical protein LC746_05520 [Acidobacteria bacterium]|nr:hypothetical protein [Acidobacteriota bacterium]
MKNASSALKCLALLVFMLALASIANAQATRTWVSGVGDDVNPCSRTAPCKTFAGAISKTAIAGEIDALDDGGYGAVTISKSITIDGGGHIASILASGTTGVNVNLTSGVTADPKQTVTLRHLTINGTGSSTCSGVTCGLPTGVRAINYTSAANLYVENCYIQGFVNEGIRMSVTATGDFLYVKDTNIQNCATGISVTTSTGFAVAALDRVRIEKMTGNGLTIGVHGHAHVRDSFFINNGGDGINMANTVTDGTVNVESTMLASNGVGIRNGGTGSFVDISNTSLMQNGTALATASGSPGGGINSHGNNQINGTVGTAPNPVGQQ